VLAFPFWLDADGQGRNLDQCHHQGQAHCQATGYVLAGTKGKPIAKRPATFWPEPRASPLPSDRLRSGRNLERHERPARAFPISG